MASLNGVITLLEDEATEIRADAEVLERCIINEDAILTASSAKFTRNLAILTATENMCNQFETEYADAEEARESELALLSALKNMVEEKLKNRVHGTGVSRGNQEESEWEAADAASGYGHDGATFEADASA
jgi:hypothetical protein